MSSIGDRIKYLRGKIVNKTQKDFGTCIGLKPNSVSDIERNKHNPTDQTIKVICQEFNINEEWLRFGNGEMFIKEDAISLDNYAKINNLTELEKKLVIGFMNLSPEIREAVFSVLENTFSNDKQNAAPKETSAAAELSQAVKKTEEAYVKSRSKLVKKQKDNEKPANKKNLEELSDEE